jgi:hypothetical protein
LQFVASDFEIFLVKRLRIDTKRKRLTCQLSILSGGATMNRSDLFQVWREDDNGNRFAMGDPAPLLEAGTIVRHYETLHHKQTYWYAKVESISNRVSSQKSSN